MANRWRAARGGAALTAAGTAAKRSPATALLAAALAAAFASNAGSALADQPPEGWGLVWADEFDGDALDTCKWNIQIGDGTAEGIPGWGNNELQSYQPGNVAVGGGHLVLAARAEAAGGRAYTSGRINTDGRFTLRYGRIEGRIRVPAGKGMWAAFWMLPSGSPYGPWPAAAQSVYQAEYELCADAVVPLALRNVETFDNVQTAVPLGIHVDDAGGALALAELEESRERGRVIDLAATGGGSLAIRAADSRLRFFGMGPVEGASLAGEIQFDLHLFAEGTDPASRLLVKLDSGPAAVGLAELPVAGLPTNEWTTVTVQIGELVRNSGGVVDLARVRSLFVLEPVGAVHLRLDDVRIRCGHKQPHGCGIAR